MKQLGFLLNLDQCIGCQTCVSACKSENHTPEGVNWRRVNKINEDVFLSLSCNHCDSPECFRVCPEKAYTKRQDGIVIINPNRCNGCMDCVSACPFNAPQFDYEQHKASKCTMCYTRLQDNLQPCCVESCPTEAIKVIDFSQDLPVSFELTVQGFPDIVLTKPSTRFIPPQPRHRYRL